MRTRAELSITQEDLKDAVQEWLDRRWTVAPPVVLKIAQDYNGSGKFTIELEGNKLFVTGAP